MSEDSLVAAGALQGRTARPRPRRLPIGVDYHVSHPKTQSKNPQHNRLRGFGLARAEVSQYVRYRRVPRERFLTDDALAALRELEARPRIYHNATVARLVERNYRIAPAYFWDDLRIMAYLLEVRPYELKDLIERFYAPTETPLPSRRHDIRARGHAEAIADIYEKTDWRERIFLEGLDVAYDIELGAVEPTVAMIENGILVDSERLQAHLTELRPQAQEARNEVRQLTGQSILYRQIEKDFNDLIRGVLKLPALCVRWDKSRTLDQRTLRRLAKQDPTGAIEKFITSQAAMLAWRNGFEILKAIEYTTGRIHPDLDPLGTDTGGFVCKSPLLHAIPESLLDVFVAPEGYTLLAASYSDIELRILAHLTHDESLLEAFCTPGSSVDLRRRTAAAALAIPEERVTGNRLNKFGRLIDRGQGFRLSALGVASELETTVERAEEVIGRLLARFPGVQQWIADTAETAEADGAARSLYGRRRTLSLSDTEILSGAEHWPELREAVDFSVEATAADILKLGLARLYEVLPNDCHLLLPLADGVLMEVPQGRAKEIAKLVRQTLEEPPTDFSVPLRVKLSRGRTWADCKGRPQRVEQDSNPS